LEQRLEEARRESGGLFRLSGRDRQLLGLFSRASYERQAALVGDELGYQRLKVVRNGNSAGGRCRADFHSRLRRHSTLQKNCWDVLGSVGEAPNSAHAAILGS